MPVLPVKEKIRGRAEVMFPQPKCLLGQDIIHDFKAMTCLIAQFVCSFRCVELGVQI